MEYTRIEELLNRYLEGESTLEEESLLKEYFSQADLPQEHRGLQEMFRYFVQANQEAAPTFDMEHALNTAIEHNWKLETRNRFRHVIAWAGSAAAVLAISFGVYQHLNKPEAIVKDTFNDPKLAYFETKRVLMLVSRSMNRNTASLKYLSKVDESFNHMKKITEIDKVVNSVKNK